jgi:hypothetical protein
MPSVELDDTEWSHVMGIIATAPWRDANPLLMKIGAQLRGQQHPAAASKQPPTLDGNGKEISHE